MKTTKKTDKCRFLKEEAKGIYFCKKKHKRELDLNQLDCKNCEENES